MAAFLLACALYMIWEAFAFCRYFAMEQGAEIPQAIVALRPFVEVLESFSAALAYVATAAFAASLARTDWLSRKASRAYIIVNVVFVLLIVIKVFWHQDPAAISLPWYTIPGSILGIPALPLIMPSWLGVVLLRRAGDEQP